MNASARGALIVAVLVVVGIVIGLAVAPSHPFEKQDFSALWITLGGGLIATLIGGVVLEKKAAVYRRFRNWWISRSEANRQKEIKRLEERRALVVDLHDNPAIYTRYVLKQLMDCIYFLGATFFLGVVAAAINVLRSFSTSYVPNAPKFILFEMQIILVVLLLAALFLMHRMVSIASMVIDVIKDVENYDTFLESTQKQIKKFSRTAGTSIVVNSSASFTLHKNSKSTEGLVVGPKLITPSTDKEEADRD